MRWHTNKGTPPTAGLMSWATQASLLRNFLALRTHIRFSLVNAHGPRQRWTLSTKRQTDADVFATVNCSRSLPWIRSLIHISSTSNPRYSACFNSSPAQVWRSITRQCSVFWSKVTPCVWYGVAPSLQTRWQACMYAICESTIAVYYGPPGSASHKPIVTGRSPPVP